MLRKIKGKYNCCMVTHQGLVREVNQDAVLALSDKNIGIYVLADGMGGHSQGELASQTIVDEFALFWKDLLDNAYLDMTFDSLLRAVENVVRKANQRIFQEFNFSQVCGSTIVVLLLFKEFYATFTVGDSRIYSLIKRKLNLLTVDDIWDTLPETTSNMTKEQIANDPRRGKLVQAIGIDQTLNIHMATNRLRYGQVFLLCSDGLFKFCKESYIEKQLIKAKNEESMRDVAQELLREVFQNGAGDNVSAIIVKAE